MVIHKVGQILKDVTILKKKLFLHVYAVQKKKKKQELRAHMALVTRQEELRAKRSYSMSFNKIL